MLNSLTLQAFASQQGYCKIQRQSFSDNIFERKGNVWHHNLQSMWQFRV